MEGKKNKRPCESFGVPLKDQIFGLLVPEEELQAEGIENPSNKIKAEHFPNLGENLST